MPVIQLRQPPNDEWVSFTIGAATMVQVANGVALTTLDSSSLPDGQLVWVETYREFFRLHKADPNPLLANVTLAATGGGPQDKWERTTIASSSVIGPWASKSDWYLNEISGDDEAAADALTPIKTIGEITRRLSGSTINQTTIVHVGSAIAHCRIDVTLGPIGAFYIDAQSAATSVGPYVTSAYTAANYAGNEAIILTAAGVNFTTLVGKRIRFTSGPANGGWAQIMAVNPAGGGTTTARITRPCSLSTDPTLPLISPLTPTAGGGDTFIIETLATMNDVGLVIRGNPDFSLLYSIGGIFSAEINNTEFGFSEFSVEAAPNMVIAGCRLVVDIFVGSLAFIVGSYFTNAIDIGARGTSYALGFYYSGINGAITSEGFVLVESLVHGKLTIQNSNIVLQNVGIFNSAGDALELKVQAGNVTLHGGALFGKNNAGYGIRTKAGTVLGYDSGKPTLTGASGDTIIGTTITAYAAIPFADATILSGIVDAS